MITRNSGKQLRLKNNIHFKLKIMIRQPINSVIGIKFRSCTDYYTGKKESKTYGYVELNNGILEISKFKNAGKLNIELRVMRGNTLKPELKKIVNSYSDIRHYVKELNYEDMSELQNLLSEIQ